MTNLSPPDFTSTSPPTDIADLSSIDLTATPSSNTVAVSWTSATAGQQTYAGPADLMPEGLRLALGHLLRLSPTDPPAYHHDTESSPNATTSTEMGTGSSKVRRHQFGPVCIELPSEFGPAEQEATERALEQAAEGLAQAAKTFGQHVSRSVGNVVDARVTFSEPTPPPSPPTSGLPSWASATRSSRRNSRGRQLGMHVVIDNGGVRREFSTFGSLARYVVQALFAGGVSAAAPETESPPTSDEHDRQTQDRKGDEKKSAVSEIGEELD